MPDTKAGRERKGAGKREQLEVRLAEREVGMDLVGERPSLEGLGGALVAEEPAEDPVLEEI